MAEDWEAKMTEQMFLMTKEELDYYERRLRAALGIPEDLEMSQYATACVGLEPMERRDESQDK